MDYSNRVSGLYKGPNVSIQVLSRIEAEKYTSSIPYAMISIGNPNDSTWAEFPEDPNRKELFRIRFFNTVHPQIHTSFSDERAELMLQFINECRGVPLPLFVIHCEHGVSRSAAVGAFISLLINGGDEYYWTNGYHAPNLLVYRRLVKAALHNK